MLDGQRIAYQVIGDGPVDFVIAPSWFSAFDMEWEEPQMRRYLERLASFTRVIRFDRRGSGASDPLHSDAAPAWEDFAEDIGCVMDAAGSESAVVYADGDVGPLGLLFAATHPDRVRALVLFSTGARFIADDDYPIGIPEEFTASISEQLTSDWGTGEQLEAYVPSRAGDPDFQRFMGRLMRAVTTPSSVKRYMEGVLTADARAVLPSLDVPTLVLHPTASQVPPVEQGRYLAEHIPGARLVELSGPGDAYPFFALADEILPAIEEFVTGARAPARAERTLATVLFTDIVESTSLAREMGDRGWRRLLDQHDTVVQAAMATHSGSLIKTTGDGILATFDGPGRAIRFASELVDGLDHIGIEIRTGIHTGEVEQRDGDIGGIAVHLCARIMASAGAGEVLVSRTVKDLVIGSSLAFRPKGTFTLKGVGGEWELYALEGRS